MIFASTLAPPSVEPAIKDLLSPAEVELAVRDRNNDFAAYKLLRP